MCIKTLETHFSLFKQHYLYFLYVKLKTGVFFVGGVGGGGFTVHLVFTDSMNYQYVNVGGYTLKIIGVLIQNY